MINRDFSRVWQYIIDSFDTTMMRENDLRLIFYYEISPDSLCIEVESNGMIGNSIDFTENVYDMLYNKLIKELPSYFVIKDKHVGSNEYGSAYKITIKIDGRKRNLDADVLLGLLRVKNIL